MLSSEFDMPCFEHPKLCWVWRKLRLGHAGLLKTFWGMLVLQHVCFTRIADQESELTLKNFSFFYAIWYHKNITILYVTEYFPLRTSNWIWQVNVPLNSQSCTFSSAQAQQNVRAVNAVNIRRSKEENGLKNYLRKSIATAITTCPPVHP